MDYLCWGDFYRSFYEDSKNRLYYVDDEDIPYITTSIQMRSVAKRLPEIAAIIWDRCGFGGYEHRAVLDEAVSDIIQKSQLVQRIRLDIRRKVFVRFYIQEDDWMIHLQLRTEDYQFIGIERPVFNPARRVCSALSSCKAFIFSSSPDENEGLIEWLGCI